MVRIRISTVAGTSCEMDSVLGLPSITSVARGCWRPCRWIGLSCASACVRDSWTKVSCSLPLAARVAYGGRYSTEWDRPTSAGLSGTGRSGGRGLLGLGAEQDIAQASQGACRALLGRLHRDWRQSGVTVTAGQASRRGIPRGSRPATGVRENADHAYCPGVRLPRPRAERAQIWGQTSDQAGAQEHECAPANGP